MPPKSTSPRGAAYIAIVIAALYYLFEFVARVEPSLAASPIAVFYKLSETEFGTLASLFFWVYAPMQIVVGLLLDRHGARPLAVPGSLLCALGVFLFIATPSPALAGAGRLLTGLGASFAFVSALYLVNHWFPPRRFALLSGAVNAIGMVGTAAGSVALTVLIADWGWRSVFFATGVFGLGIFVLAFLFLRDAPGCATSSEDSMLAHIGGKLRGVFGSRRIWLIAVLGMLYYVPINVFGVLWGHEALTQKNGLSSVQAQTAIGMIFWGAAGGSVVFGALSDVWGHRQKLILVGLALAIITFGALIYLPLKSVYAISAMLFAGGFFVGGQMLTFAMAKEGISAKNTGTVVAFVNMIGIGGAIVFQPLTGYLLELFDNNFTKALTLMPVALIVAALLALFLRDECHPDHSRDK